MASLICLESKLEQCSIMSFCCNTTDSLQKLSVDRPGTFLITMDISILYTSNPHESVSFLGTCISVKDGHLCTSLYQKPTDNLMVLHFSSFHPKHIKEAIPNGQALSIHRIYSDEEECDGHLKILKDAHIRTGYNAQPIKCQIQRTTVKNHNDPLRRWTQDTTDRVPFVAQHFPGTERLHHVLCSLQHVIDDDEHLAKFFRHFHFLPSNNRQTLNRPSFADNIDHDTNNPALATSARH
eukprot:g27645.t1